MKRKLINFIPFLVLGLTFLVISLLLFFFRKNHKLLAAKLKTGALLISLTTLLGNACPIVGIPTCYIPIMPNEISLADATYNSEENLAEITISLAVSTILNGNLYASTETAYSFRLETQAFEEVIRGEIVPVDGVIDSDGEEVVIDLGPDLVEGSYYLYLFTGLADDQSLELDEYEMYMGSLKKYLVNVVE